MISAEPRAARLAGVRVVVARNEGARGGLYNGSLTVRAISWVMGPSGNRLPQRLDRAFAILTGDIQVRNGADPSGQDVWRHPHALFFYQLLNLPCRFPGVGHV